jgi:hypothetical protein
MVPTWGCGRITALVTVHLGQEVMVRQMEGAGGYLSQSSPTLFFSLGERTHIDWAEIRWPGGQRDWIDNPAINTLQAKPGHVALVNGKRHRGATNLPLACFGRTLAALPQRHFTPI